MTRLVVFLMVLEIFNNESVNSTFKYKLGGFNTWELVPDITNYKLEFMTQKFSTPRFSRSSKITEFLRYVILFDSINLNLVITFVQ